MIRKLTARDASIPPASPAPVGPARALEDTDPRASSPLRPSRAFTEGLARRLDAEAPDHLTLVPGRAPDMVGFSDLLASLGRPEARDTLAARLPQFIARRGRVARSIVEHAIGGVDTLVPRFAIDIRAMRSSVDAVHWLHRVGLLADVGASGGPKALAADNGVFRQDAVETRVLPKQVDLAEALAAPPVVPELPRQVDLAPGVVAGYLPSGVDDRRRGCNMVLAEAFDRLSRPEEGFELVVGGRRCRSVEALLDALEAMGARVEATVAGQAAHVTAIYARGTDGTLLEVPTPIQLETHVRDASGAPAVVPAIHTAFEIHVRGAGFDGDLLWYTGIRGTHFYAADLFAQPRWAGRVELGQLDATETREALRVASRLGPALDRHAQLRGLIASGYGRLGVCNDSVAMVLATLGRPVDIYPLVGTPREIREAVLHAMRGADADGRRLLGRVLETMREVPFDGPYTRSTARRALASLPYRPGEEPLVSAIEARRILEASVGPGVTVR